MESDIAAFTKACATHQRFKKKRKKYGDLPLKDVSMIPWETICIDLVGPYTVTDKLGNDRTLLTITFVDPATGWFEITEIPDKSSARISHIFNSMWLAWYGTLAHKKSSLIMEMSSKMISYIFSMTLLSSQHPQPLKIHSLMPYWKGYIKF